MLGIQITVGGSSEGPNAHPWWTSRGDGFRAGILLSRMAAFSRMLSTSCSIVTTDASALLSWPREHSEEVQSASGSSPLQFCRVDYCLHCSRDN